MTYMQNATMKQIKSNFQLDSLIYYRYYYCGIGACAQSHQCLDTMILQVFVCVFLVGVRVFETVVNHIDMSSHVVAAYTYLLFSTLRQYDANKIKKMCTSIRAKGNDKTYTFTHVLYFFFIK